MASDSWNFRLSIATETQDTLSMMDLYGCRRRYVPSLKNAHLMLQGTLLRIVVHPAA